MGRDGLDIAVEQLSAAGAHARSRDMLQFRSKWVGDRQFSNFGLKEVRAVEKYQRLERKRREADRGPRRIAALHRALAWHEIVCKERGVDKGLTGLFIKLFRSFRPFLMWFFRAVESKGFNSSKLQSNSPETDMIAPQLSNSPQYCEDRSELGKKKQN